jgi:hypothetical protein
MKKKFAFGRPGEVDKLRWPKSATEGAHAEEIMTKMKTKSLIYEVTLVSWIERTDVDANGQVFKQVIEKARRNNYEHANDDHDVVVCDLKFYQKNTHPAIGTTTLFSWDNYRVRIGTLKSEVVRKPIEMCKRTEKAIF